MPVSAQQRLLRTLIAALKAVAAKYNVVLDGFQERTATDAAVRRAYKKVVRKAHPDKGGDAEDFRTVPEGLSSIHQQEPRGQGFDQESPKAGQ